MDMIGEWIRDIAVFLIVSAAVLHAVPGKRLPEIYPVLYRADPDPPAGGADPGTVRHGPPV